jgi:phenol hydroxylase P0 protein
MVSETDNNNGDGGFDPAKKYVRVSLVRADGMVEFDFSIGTPELYVELMLPLDAFSEFCEMNRVIVLSGERREWTAESVWSWSLKQARECRPLPGR